jgi:excisionase family DNA binding protein
LERRNSTRFEEMHMEANVTRPFLSVPEAGARLGETTRTTYNLIKDEGLPVIKLRGRLRVPAGALEKWIAAREREALEQTA